jgi:hypothetical protein
MRCCARKRSTVKPVFAVLNVAPQIRFHSPRRQQ